MRASSMPQWVYSWYGWGRPAWAASVAEGPVGLVAPAAGPLPHAARSMATTAPAIGGPPRPSKPFSISLLARVRSASPFGTRPRGPGFRRLVAARTARLSSPASMWPGHADWRGDAGHRRVLQVSGAWTAALMWLKVHLDQQLPAGLR